MHLLNWFFSFLIGTGLKLDKFNFNLSMIEEMLYVSHEIWNKNDWFTLSSRQRKRLNSNLSKNKCLSVTNWTDWVFFFFFFDLVDDHTSRGFSVKNYFENNKADFKWDSSKDVTFQKSPHQYHLSIQHEN